MSTSRIVRMPRFWLPPFFLLVFAAIPAAAQDRTGTVEITPFGGGYLGGRLHAGSNAVFSQSVDVQSAGTFGVRVAVNASRWFGIEAGFATARADVEGTGGSGLFSSGTKLGEMEFKQYELNGVFNFGRGRAVPYLTLGAGATTFSLEVPGTSVSDDTRFTANMGLGVKVFFNPHVALRFEGRGRAAYVNDSNRSCTNSIFCDGSGRRNDENRWYGSGEVTGGLTLAF